MLGPVSGLIVLTMLVANVDLTSAAPQERPLQEAQAPADPSWPPAGVSRAGKDIVLPRVISEVRPNYTADALRGQVQGSVMLEAIVKVDGTVGEVRVKKSLDTRHGLDEQAVRAVKQWRFRPGTKDGSPVPVLVEIEMTFSMKK